MNKSIFKYLAAVLYVFLLLPPFNLVLAVLFNKITKGVDIEGNTVLINSAGSIGVGIEGIIIAIAVALICVQLGFILGEKADVKLLKFAVSLIVSTLLGSIILLFFGRPIIQVACVVLFMTVCGYVAINLSFQVLSEYFSRARLMKYIIINLICWFLSGSMPETRPVVYQMLIGFTVAFVLTMFMINRGLLETVYRKKMTEAGVVDKRVQKYNVKIVAAFSVVFIALILVKDYVTQLINTLLKLAGMKLIEGFIPTEGGGTVVTTPQPEVTTPPISTGTTTTGDNRANLINSILFVVVCVVLAVVLFLIIRFLIKNGPRKIRAAIRNLGDIFKGLTKKSEHVRKTFSSDYKDTFEKVDDESKGTSSKKFKDLQNQKKIRKIIDPTEKMRAFYAFFMNVIVKNNVPIKASNTTTELQDKADLIYSAKDRNEYVTEKYNRLRYADVVPGESDLSTVDEYLSDMSKNSISLKEEKDDKSIRKKRRN